MGARRGRAGAAARSRGRGRGRAGAGRVGTRRRRCRGCAARRAGGRWGSREPARDRALAARRGAPDRAGAGRAAARGSGGVARRGARAPGRTRGAGCRPASPRLPGPRRPAPGPAPAAGLARLDRRLRGRAGGGARRAASSAHAAARPRHAAPVGRPCGALGARAARRRRAGGRPAVAAAWIDSARRELREAYGAGLRVRNAPIAIDERIVRALEAEKAVDELLYAVRFLPTWLDVPVAALRTLT